MTIAELEEDYGQTKDQIDWIKKRLESIDRDITGLFEDKRYWSERLESMEIDLEDIRVTLEAEREAQEIANEVRNEP